MYSPFLQRFQIVVNFEARPGRHIGADHFVRVTQERHFLLFHILPSIHTISSQANIRFVTLIPVLVRNRKSPCDSAIILSLGQLLDSVSLLQNELSQSLAYPFGRVLRDGRLLQLDPLNVSIVLDLSVLVLGLPAPSPDNRCPPPSTSGRCRYIGERDLLHLSSGLTVLPRIRGIRENVLVPLNR